MGRGEVVEDGHASTLWESVVAFANSDQGGLVLLGVDENHGAFDVVGVDKPAEVAATFASMCAGLEPPLRPSIQTLAHPDGVVISAVIRPVPRSQMPCHKVNEEATTSYIRVGDRDDRMTQAEIDELRLNRTSTDHGRRPAPVEARLDPELKAEILRQAKIGSDRKSTMTDDQLLYRIGVTDENSSLTLAGLLSIGVAPETLTNAARVAYRETPTERDPEGARFVNAAHVEGTIGEILDELIDKLRRALRPSVVVGSNRVSEQLDVPFEALREVLANALVHRSLSPGQDSTSGLVEVSPDHVLVMNPGGVHPDVSLRQLGLNPLSTPRNRSLATACGYLRTPSGQKITEGQASGIPAADRACHEAGTAPALFSTHPTLFSVLLLRGRLPVDDIRQRWSTQGVVLDESEGRLCALAVALDGLHNDDVASGFTAVHLDAALAARALAPCQPERAAAILSTLEVKGVLRAGQVPDRMVWRPLQPRSVVECSTKAPEATKAVPTAKEPSSKARRREQVAQLVEHIRLNGPIGQSDVQTSFGVAKATAASIVKSAIAAGLIEPSSDVPHDPTRTYHLTSTGQRLKP